MIGFIRIQVERKAPALIKTLVPAVEVRERFGQIFTTPYIFFFRHSSSLTTTSYSIAAIVNCVKDGVEYEL